jgi:predicted anti-sigma-YlaC factor YlaD
MGAVLSMECERARRWASLGLDGELSQVEEALLRAHVGRCAACADFALELDGLTQELRTAPFQRPRRSMPARRRTSGMRGLRLGAAVAAAIAIAAGLGSLAGSLTSANPAPRTRHVSLISLRLALAAAHPPVRPGTRLTQRTPV